MRKFIIAIALLAGITPTLATGEIESLITDADRERLANFDATRSTALAEAKTGGSATDIAILDEVTSRKALSMGGFDPTGDWQCRTIKAGGLAQLVVYGWFRCRITDDGAGWTLQKLTGSQRTKGRFFTESSERLTYLGSFAVNDDPFPSYGTGPDSDQIGYATRNSNDAFIIEFPAPRYESKLDILEFRR